MYQWLINRKKGLVTILIVTLVAIGIVTCALLISSFVSNRDARERRQAIQTVRSGCGPDRAKAFKAVFGNGGWGHNYVNDQAAEWVKRCQTGRGG